MSMTEDRNNLSILGFAPDEKPPFEEIKQRCREMRSLYFHGATVRHDVQDKEALAAINDAYSALRKSYQKGYYQPGARAAADLEPRPAADDSAVSDTYREFMKQNEREEDEHLRSIFGRRKSEKGPADGNRFSAPLWGSPAANL